MNLTLSVWFSPAFPVGAFAYSHGLEWAHEAGDIRTEEDLRAWLATLVAQGALPNDLLLLGEAFRAAGRHDEAGLRAVNDLALALATTRERHLETATQGTAFLLAARSAWPRDGMDRLSDAEEVAYPVAVGLAAACHDLPLDETLAMFALGFVSNLVSAAVRLGIVGQSGGQRVLAALLKPLREEARLHTTGSLDDLGASAFRSDLASLQHETQYTRLFRS